MDDSIEKLCQTLEIDIREGRIDAAIKKFRRLKLPIKRTHALRVANLARRVRLYDYGLRVLAPFVRKKKGQSRPTCSPSEAIEFAMLLLRSGIDREALELLSSVDAEKTPEAFFVKATWFISQWDYEKAIPYLEAYLARVTSPYAKLIGQVNLAAALIAVGEHASAEELIQSCVAECEENGWERARSNLNELTAQILVARSELDAARIHLERAAKGLGMGQTHDQLYIRKWLAVISSKMSTSVEPLNEFRREALALQDWASVREADLFALNVSFDQEKFDLLYFGTPAPAYRSRITKITGVQPQSKVLTQGHSEKIIFDLATGEIQGAQLPLKAGSKPHQLLVCLFRDFYAPISVGAIFSALYPEEFFDPFSSPERVRQVLSRTRKWIDLSGVPLAIEELNGLYRIYLTGKMTIHFPLQRGSFNSYQVLLLRMLNLGSDNNISGADLRQQLDLSFGSFQRFTRWALEEGYLQKLGSGTKTRYRLITASGGYKENS